MGDPKKNRKKYSRPAHPWQKERIEQEKELMKEYGLKNKKDIWRMRTPLDHFKTRVKSIISKSGAEAQEEQAALIMKLQSMGLVNQGAGVDDVLSLTVKDFLERRLQTIVYRKGLARTITQARQLITHEHIHVKGMVINGPSYLVTREDEGTITYPPNSPFADPEHPERTAPEPKEEEPKKEGKKGKKKKTEEPEADDALPEAEE